MLFWKLISCTEVAQIPYISRAWSQNEKAMTDEDSGVVCEGSYGDNDAQEKASFHTYSNAHKPTPYFPSFRNMVSFTIRYDNMILSRKSKTTR